MNNTKTAQVYGVSVPTICRWNRVGVESGQAPPYGDPEHMVAWYEEMLALGHFEKGVPATLHAAANRVRAAMPRDEDEPDRSTDDLQVMLARIQSGESTFDYADGVKIAERNIQVLDFLLLDAIKKNNITNIGLIRKQLSEAGDSYRALMRDRGRIQADAGETLPKNEVRAAMIEIHGNIVKRFRQGIKAAFPSIDEHGKTQEEWSLFSEKLVDSICAGLNSTDFAAK